VSNNTYDTPDEIQKWIENRKKNYPSKKNIERKEKLIHEKAEKGIPIAPSDLKDKNNLWYDLLFLLYLDN
jgi:hypothetical protein